MSKPICTICGNKAVAKQLCDKHYRRWRKYGDPTKLQRTGAKNGTKHPLYQTWRWFSRHQNLVDHWKTFVNFRDDLIERPSDKHTLQRINKDKPLGPGNFYWQERIASSADRNAYAREWRKKNVLNVKSADLKRCFGITLKDYEDMLEGQDSKCKICKKPETSIIKGKLIALAVDHCHDTGKVRGLLCSRCNQGLGNFKDNIETMTVAIQYLKDSRE